VEGAVGQGEAGGQTRSQLVGQDGVGQGVVDVALDGPS
jgi:hypothetical protein